MDNDNNQVVDFTLIPRFNNSGKGEQVLMVEPGGYAACLFGHIDIFHRGSISRENGSLYMRLYDEGETIPVVLMPRDEYEQLKEAAKNESLLTRPRARRHP